MIGALVLVGFSGAVLFGVGYVLFGWASRWFVFMHSGYEEFATDAAVEAGIDVGRADTMLLFRSPARFTSPARNTELLVLDGLSGATVQLSPGSPPSVRSVSHFETMQVRRVRDLKFRTTWRPVEVEFRAVWLSKRAVYWTIESDYRRMCLHNADSELFHP